jgi:hypothetical protein
VVKKHLKLRFPFCGWNMSLTLTSLSTGYIAGPCCCTMQKPQFLQTPLWFYTHRTLYFLVTWLIIPQSWTSTSYWHPTPATSNKAEYQKQPHQEKRRKIIPNTWVITHHVYFHDITGKAFSANRTLRWGNRRSDLWRPSRRPRGPKWGHRQPRQPTQLQRVPDRGICHRHGWWERGRFWILHSALPCCEWKLRYVNWMTWMTWFDLDMFLHVKHVKYSVSLYPPISCIY